MLSLVLLFDARAIKSLDINCRTSNL